MHLTTVIARDAHPQMYSQLWGCMHRTTAIARRRTASAMSTAGSNALINTSSLFGFKQCASHLVMVVPRFV